VKIRCSTCGKEYNIKEDILLAYKDKESISVPCPTCKAAIVISVPKGQGAGQVQETKPGILQQDKAKLAGDGLKERIFRTLKDLPPMPQVAQKARQVLANPNSSYSDLAKVIETDQGIVTRVLKMANSPYYGLSGNVSTVQHASAVLGSKTLMELLNLACSSEILGKTLMGYDLSAGDLWKHSLAVARASQVLARRVQPALEQDAFSAGLIHDVGKIILDPYINERKTEFQSHVSLESESFLVAEKKILGFDHAELASEVCEKWQIPRHIALSIRFHHDPTPSDKDILTYIVHMADAIAIMSGIGTGMDGMLYSIHKEAMGFLNVAEDDVMEVMADVASYVEKTTQE
jgi:putative nucleotidyltransferase with HDIG domain